MTRLSRGLGLLWLGGLALNWGVHAAETANPAPPPEWPRVFRLGFVAVSGGEKASDPSQVVGAYLARELKMKVEVISSPDYLSLIAGLKSGNREGAYLGPYPYVEAMELAEVEGAAMELDPQGRRGYHSILITRADSGLRRLEEAEGRVLAFTYPDSTSGCLIPLLHFLRELGRPPGTFASKVVFAGSHQAVVRGVFEQTYAVGATNDLDFARSLQELKLTAEDFYILWTSALIPGSVYVLRRNLPPSFKQAVQRSLLELKDPSLLGRMNIGGFGPVDYSEYQVIRELRGLKE